MEIKRKTETGYSKDSSNKQQLGYEKMERERAEKMLSKPNVCKLQREEHIKKEIGKKAETKKIKT